MSTALDIDSAVAPTTATMEGFLDLDHLLDDEQRILQRTMRSFVEREVLPTIEQYHRQGGFPVHLVGRLAELGILGATVQDYDLPGLDPASYGLVLQELERGDSGLRSFASVQNALVIHPLMAFGSKEQRDRWVPGLAGGEVIGCFGLTEPDFGSNPSGMRTRARRTRGGYIVDGSKAWITNGSLADLALIWAKDDAGAVRGLLLERGQPGFESQPHQGKFSLRVSDTSQLFFNECFVDDDHVLPGATSLKHPLACLSEARYGIAWGAIGAALAVAEHALQYTRQRVQFGGSPIAAHQLVQEKLVFMVSEIGKAQLLAWHLAGLKRRGRLHHSQISLAKRNNVWMARKCARLARELLGAAGIVDDHPVIRHMLNLEAVYTYEGTHEIHGLVIGHHLTGLPAYGPAGS